MVKKIEATLAAEPVAGPVPSPADAADIAELRAMTAAMLESVSSLRAERDRTRIIESAAEDVRAASRAVALRSADLAPRGAAHPAKDCDCGCGPCDCVSDNCCSFDITMTHARCIEMQIPAEFADSNINPSAQMEIRMFASIDGIGAVIPNLFSTIDLRKNIGKPGLWTQVNRAIGAVTVCKGQTKTVTVAVDAVEVDDGRPAEVAMGRDEHGSGNGSFILDCCLPTPATLNIEVQLDHYGLGGGAIEVKLTATKVCC